MKFIIASRPFFVDVVGSFLGGPQSHMQVVIGQLDVKDSVALERR